MAVEMRGWASCCLFLFTFLFFSAATHGRHLPIVKDSRIAPSSAGQAAQMSSPLSPSQDAQTVVEKHQHYHKELFVAIILISVAVIMVLIASVCAFMWCRSTKDMKGLQSADTTNKSKLDSLRIARRGTVSMIEYLLLEAATDNFSEGNILGAGAFGRVYKAKFARGVAAAVKKLDCRGQDAEHEFENEMDLLGKIQHPNIVSLLCYCIHDKGHFIVYELMENGSLEEQLHGPTHGSTLSWYIRMKIAVDIARGLEYLHEHCNPPVIHRDLKSSNILLDSDFSAKIADFGLAVAVGNHNKGSLKLSGTLGYVAPEYLLDGKLTEKSDVYAFGVVLLELLIGKKPVEKTAPSQCQSIVTLAMPLLTDRTKLPSIIDPVIRNTMDLKHLYQVAAVAVLCVQPEPSYRPLITDVLHSLIPLVPVELGGTMRTTEQLPWNR